MTQALKQRLVTTLIYPHLDYCCCIVTGITAGLDRRLYRAINASVRFILDLKRDEHMTPYYRHLRWLKPEARRKYFVGCLLHKIMLTQRPKIIYNKLLMRSKISSRSTQASAEELSFSQCRTEIYNLFFALHLNYGMSSLLK